MRRIPALLLTLILITSCSGSSSGDDSSSSTYSLELSFLRTDSGGKDPFAVTALLKNNGNPHPGVILSVDVSPPSQTSSPTVSPVTDLGDGNYRFTVTPDQTGEHAVTVSYRDTSITRTALVMRNVHADWEQPMSVAGLVNTEGYEDGVTITPDGEYLFVQTSPQYFSGIFVFNELRANGGTGGNRLDPTEFHHPWMDTLAGTYTAPERPGFFDGRYDGMNMRHNANSWGVSDNAVPNYAISTMFYGFKRQPDGSFREPFYIAFEDENDGLIGPFGLSFKMNGDGTARTIFSFQYPDQNDQHDVDFNGNGFYDDGIKGGFDVYTTEITFGSNNILGKFIPSGVAGTAPIKSTPFPSYPVTFSDTGIEGIYGTQGNASYYESGGIILIFTDDEYDTNSPASDDHGDISVYVNTNAADFPGGTWGKVLLPPVINTADDEIQPFFDGTRLIFTNITRQEVYYSIYSGGLTLAGLTDNTNWSTPEAIMEHDGSAVIGTINVIGEPTLCSFNGEEYLYFVYGIIRAIDDSALTTFYDINLQAGYIKKR